MNRDMKNDILRSKISFLPRLRWLLALCMVLTTFVAGVVSHAHAHAQEVPAEPDYSTPEKTLEALVHQIQGSIRTLDHDVFVYHYRPRKRFEEISKTQEKAAAVYSHYVRKTVYGTDAGDFVGMLGRGLYAAIDPVQSRSYGGENWVLFQIRLARGSRYWMVQDPTTGAPLLDQSTISSELSMAMERHFGCSMNSDGRLVTRRRCYHLRRLLLLRLKVAAISYHWGVGPRDVGPTLCKIQRGDAFFLTNLAPFRAEDIRVFGPSHFPFLDELADDLSEDRRAIQRMFDITGNPPLWPLLSRSWLRNRKSTHDEARAWAKKNLLVCDPN